MRFTIGRKISLGFGVLILSTLVVFFFTDRTLESSRSINQKIKTVYDPSSEYLDELELLLERSHRLIGTWVLVESKDDERQKAELRALIYREWPKFRKKAIDLAKNWNKEEQENLSKLFVEIDSLFVLHQDLMQVFNSLESYGSVEIVFGGYNEQLEEGGLVSEQTRKIRQSLNALKLKTEANKTSVKIQETQSFSKLEFWLKSLGIALVIGGLLIGFFTATSIVRPVKQLKRILLTLGTGRFPEREMKPTKDEIGEMSKALNTLVDGLKRTTSFSREVGSGNFDYPHEPLGEEDELGHALLRMRDSLAANERELEQKVVERTIELQQEKQKVEELYTDVTASIRYAKRLQLSILPPDTTINELAPDSFVFFRPKDIVSGDFYWFERGKGGKVLFSAVDCTGHGVPGAFMSLIGYNALNQIVRINKITKPSNILNALNLSASKALNKDSEGMDVKDSMDLALCSLDREKGILEYAGAHNPLYIIRKGELTIVKADKLSIGGFIPEEREYTNHRIEVEKGDLIYIFSDGYADQFGGAKGKKMLYSRFRHLLGEIYELPLEQQKSILGENLDTWMGEMEQIDDILVIGVKV